MPARKSPKVARSSRGLTSRPAKSRPVKARTGTSRRVSASEPSASRLIDERIRELGDWRGETLARVRTLILQIEPATIEEWKWGGTPVWSNNGIVCTGETYAKVVKLTFAKGASLDDPSRLFNSSLDGGTRRAIDIREGESVDARAFKALVKAAVARNGAGSRKGAKAGARKASKAPVLLSGGNPQVAKGDGDAPVQEFIAAMPGWKREVGRRLDAIVVRAVPHVRKAVRWNTPFYGVEGQGYFLGFHVLSRYVKVAFLRGASLRPPPPEGGKDPDARYLHVHEHDEMDEAQLVRWVKQAAALPGWIP